MAEKYKLDKKDVKILTELYNDGRALISKLSKLTGIQRDSIKYRINKLRKQGVISGTHSNINYEKIGFPTLYKLDINIQNYNLKEEDEFIDFLIGYPNVVYIEHVTGKFDLTLVVGAKNANDFYNILKDIRSHYPEVIRDHEISTINKILKFWDYRGIIEFG